MNIKERQNKVKELVDGMDAFCQQVGCTTVDVLNATSIMSTMTAHSVGLTKKDYLDNITKMFDDTFRERQPEPIPFAGMVDTGEDDNDNLERSA